MSISYALDIKIDSRIRDYVWNWFETILAKPSMILRIFAQTWKSGERRCITFILSLIPSAYRLSKSKWPAPIFPPLRQRGFRGMDATVHAIFRQFLPTADLSCIEEFLLLGTLWPRLVCSRCSRSRSRPKTVSISIGWNGPLLLLLLLLFLVVVLPLFRTFDGSTNGKRRKFVAGSLIFPIGLFSSNPKKFQRILLNARICFTTLDKKKQSCNSFSHPPLLHFPPHILFRSTVPFSRFIPFFHVNFLQSLTFAPSSSTFRLIILFTILRNDASFLHSFPFKIFTRIVHQSRNFSPFFLFISTIFSRSTILSEKKERKKEKRIFFFEFLAKKWPRVLHAPLPPLLLTRSPVLFISVEEAGRKRRLRRTTWRRRALRHSTRGNLCCAHVFHFSYPSPVPLLAYLVFS